MTRQRERKREKAQHGTPAGEWVAAALGLLLVATTIAVLVRAAVTGETPPDLVVEVTAIEPSAGGYRVEVRVRNRGSAAAAGVSIEGALSRGEERIETRGVTLSYVPGSSAAAGGIFFAHDPRALTLELRALGYESP